ncbi:MAG: cupin domain-containing protein [Bacteroidota bacterium]
MENKTKCFVNKMNAVKRQFLGVDFDVLAIGRQSMVTKMLYKTTDNVPFHNHPNEQSGYVLSGKFKLQFENNVYIMTAGDSYSIPADAKHSMQIIEAGEIIDFFTPIREDYL